MKRKAKTQLEKLVDEKFEGIIENAANEMVVLFCNKYGIPGSGNGHDFYELVQEVWRQAIKQENEARDKFIKW